MEYLPETLGPPSALLDSTIHCTAGTNLKLHATGGFVSSNKHLDREPADASCWMRSVVGVTNVASNRGKELLNPLQG